MISKFPIISNDERDEAELIGNLYSPGTSSPHAKTLSQAGNGLLSPPDRLREDDEAGPSRMAWESTRPAKSQNDFSGEKMA